MPRPRGSSHTTLTETATLVVRELTRVPGIKMIAPGEIKTASRRSGDRRVTIVETTAGAELIITGQSVQRVAVHTAVPQHIYPHLKKSKKLKGFTISTRERKPGV